jgi:hypothetical protein
MKRAISRLSIGILGELVRAPTRNQPNIAAKNKHNRFNGSRTLNSRKPGDS